MIRKLKIKMLLLSGVALLILLALTVIGVNIFAYRSLVRSADEMLDFAYHEYLANEAGDIPLPVTPSNIFERRYIYILTDCHGHILELDNSRFPSVTDGQAKDIAKSIVSKTKNGFIEKYRYSVNEKDGERLITLLHCGQIIEIFTIFVITSIVIAAAAFALAMTVISILAKRILRPISESYEKQRRFITDAGHEIKTPLTVINANVDLLMMDGADNEALEDIKQQTSRLTTLTNNLILLSKMGEETKNELKTDFPLSEVVTEASAAYDAPARTGGKVIKRKITPMISMTGDMRSISHLVEILMDNAVKYSSDGSEISITLSKYGKQALLSVENSTDFEVKRETLPKLFDRFYRADPSRNSQRGGHGIGLSIAEAIVKAHSGKIFAVSSGPHHFKINAYLPL